MDTRTLICAIVLAAFYYIKQAYIGYTLWQLFAECFPMALVAGLIYGDVPKAMMIAAAINLIYIGALAPGGQLPADKYMACAIAIPIALQTGMKTEMAITLAIPIAMLGAFLFNFKRILNITWVSKAEKFAREGNARGIWRCATIYPMLISVPLFYVPAFLGIMFGQNIVTPFLNILPKWLMHGLEVSGGILPAIGFCLVLIMIGKEKYLPFFGIGFILIKVLGMPTLVAAVFAACVALAIVIFKRENKEELKNAGN
ncbi:PTS sugar transporter subunit IIC [Lactovum odontotermitis]